MKTTTALETSSNGADIKKIKPGSPPRADPIEVPLVTQEEINHMAPTIPITTHKIVTQVEDEPLP